MYQVPEADRKEILKYLSTKPYIEVAPLIAMLAQWKKKETEKNGKAKTDQVYLSCLFWQWLSQDYQRRQQPTFKGGYWLRSV